MGFSVIISQIWMCCSPRVPLDGGGLSAFLCLLITADSWVQSEDRFHFHIHLRESYHIPSQTTFEGEGVLFIPTAAFLA